MKFTWLYDVIALLGMALISFGAWLIYEPSAYIIIGLMLVIIAVLGASKTARKR